MELRDLAPPTQDILEYRKKQRPLRVRFLDGAVKTILVDDSQNVVDLTRAICARIGESLSLEQRKTHQLYKKG